RLLKGLDKLEELSFRHSSFDKSLDISDNTFNCIPDLTNTKLTNQVSLGRMKIKKKYSNGGDHDGERLCRLKELAEANKSYQQALDFHVTEMQANRERLPSEFYKKLDYAFYKIAIYGQSITLPLKNLGYLTLLFTSIYASMSIVQHPPGHWYDWIDRFFIGLLYSLSQVFPFVSAGRNSAADSLNQLFPCETIPDGFYFFSIFQGVLSVIFSFLICLGFRNRFRR
ncbi:hypothetical protein BMR09_17525, partial [Methylococcaceae bacterium CS3]